MTNPLKRFIPLAAFLLLLSSAAMADSSSSNDFSGSSQTPVFTQGDFHNRSRWDENGGRDGRSPITVPEPSSIACTGMGLLGVLEVIRRKARL
jgi:hypothetical protein